MIPPYVRVEQRCFAPNADPSEYGKHHRYADEQGDDEFVRDFYVSVDQSGGSMLPPGSTSIWARCSLPDRSTFTACQRL